MCRSAGSCTLVKSEEAIWRRRVTSLEENKAIARRHYEELWTKGDLAVGREVSVSGFHLYRIVDGRIVEVWAQPDVFGFMYQLGLLPPATTEVA